MTRLVWIVAVVSTLSASAASRVETLRWIAAQSGRAECRKEPLADGGAVDPKLKYFDFRQTAGFLHGLEPYLYSYDTRWVSTAARIVESSSDGDIVAIFTMNALAPWLKSVGYFDLKRRYLEPALDNLACLDDAFGIKGLGGLKGIVVFQSAALGLGVAALEGADRLMTKAQAERAASWAKFIADTTKLGLTPVALEKIRKEIPAMRDFVKGLTPNPLLRGRVETMILLLDFLVE